MSRIKWELARRLIGRYYLVQPNNWPLRFAPVHLAHLQAPPDGKDKKKTEACQDAIEYAAGIGELPCTIESFNFPPSDIEGIFDAEDADMGDKWLAACSVQELPAIATDDFRRWLESQREKPSEHIQAWFDVWLESDSERVRVQAQWDGIKNDLADRHDQHTEHLLNEWQENLAPAPPPRRVEPHTAPAQTAAPVVTETPKERRARQLAMFEIEEKREKRGALQRLANSEGLDHSNLSKDIKRAKAEREEEKRAGIWTSQLIRDGKR